MVVYTKPRIPVHQAQLTPAGWAWWTRIGLGGHKCGLGGHWLGLADSHWAWWTQVFWVSNLNLLMLGNVIN